MRLAIITQVFLFRVFFILTFAGSPYVFGLLQLLISEYLHHQLDITKCDELSAEMLDLLLSLMKFGFYNTAEQIQDVVDPLVEARVLLPYYSYAVRFWTIIAARRHARPSQILKKVD